MKTIVLLFIISSKGCFAQSFRPYYSNDGRADKHGFVNFRLFNNTILNMRPARNVTVSSRAQCAEECVMLPKPFCQSINIEQISENEFNCSILLGDRIRYSYFYKAKNGTEHYGLRV